jgi:hypothetical protein
MPQEEQRGCRGLAILLLYLGARPLYPLEISQENMKVNNKTFFIL